MTVCESQVVGRIDWRTDNMSPVTYQYECLKKSSAFSLSLFLSVSLSLFLSLSLQDEEDEEGQLAERFQTYCESLNNRMKSVLINFS